MLLHQILTTAANQIFGASRLTITASDASTVFDLRVGQLTPSDPVKYDIYSALLDAYINEMLFGMRIELKSKGANEYHFIVTVNKLENPAHDNDDVAILILTVIDGYVDEQVQAKAAAQAAVSQADANKTIADALSAALAL